MVERQGSVSWDGFYSAVQSQKAVSAYMYSEQILTFSFAE